MICRRYSQYSKLLSVFIYLVPVLIPLIYLAVTGGQDDTQVLNQRRFGLLMNSVKIAAPVVFICLIISVMVAMRVHTAFRRRPVMRWFFLLLAPVPSYIYALSYMNLIRFAGMIFPSVLKYQMAGVVPCILVESMAFLPFACAAALTGLEQVNAQEWRAALLFDNADRVFFKVILPVQLPWLLAMGAVIFVLSITDYSIPSLFQVNVYAMEIFSDYSAAGQSLHSLRLSAPLIFISTVIILIFMFSLNKSFRPMKTDRNIYPVYSKGLTAAGNAAVILALLQIILPVISLIPYIGVGIRQYVSAGKELINSCLIGILAVLLLMIPAALMALTLTKSCGVSGFMLWAAALIPLSVPGVLTGIGVLKLFSDTPLYIFRNGIIMPAVGMAVRYLPFAMLVQYGCYLRIDRDKLRAARLLAPSAGKALLKVQLPLMASGFIISGIVVFLLTLGDVGTVLILMGAGKEPLSVKIYNYLHYGSSETVAVFCLIQMTVCILLMLMLYVFAGKRVGKADRTDD